MVRRERAFAMCRDLLVRQHRPQVFVSQRLDPGDFVRRPEAVEEVHHRDA